MNAFHREWIYGQKTWMKAPTQMYQWRPMYFWCFIIYNIFSFLFYNVLALFNVDFLFKLFVTPKNYHCFPCSASSVRLRACFHAARRPRAVADWLFTFFIARLNRDILISPRKHFHGFFSIQFYFHPFFFFLDQTCDSPERIATETAASSARGSPPIVEDRPLQKELPRAANNLRSWAELFWSSKWQPKFLVTLLVSLLLP